MIASAAGVSGMLHGCAAAACSAQQYERQHVLLRPNKRRRRIVNMPLTPAEAIIDKAPISRRLILKPKRADAWDIARLPREVREYATEFEIRPELWFNDLRGSKVTEIVWSGISVPDLAIRIGRKIETAAKMLRVYAALPCGDGRQARRALAAGGSPFWLHKFAHKANSKCNVVTSGAYHEDFMATTSSLATRIARDILDEIASGEIAIGEHLSAQRIADRFEVSRSPVREALLALADQGYLEQHQNRGYFVRAAPPVLQPTEKGGEIEAHPFETPNDYQRIAEDWLTNRIPAEVTEQMLRERYDLTKAQLHDILVRASREGWIERKQGYGWRFLPVAKTAEAFDQIYRFRQTIEPAAMLEPTFRVDRLVLREQRRIQERMLEHDIEPLPGERLLESGAIFHEELIKFSGNPFFHQALVRVNRMRRLLEYRTQIDRRRLYVQCTEHLEIIGLLEAGEVVDASFLMRRHLGGALSTKLPSRAAE